MAQDDELTIRYFYSRESETLDGIIEFDKQTQNTRMIKPCGADEGSEWSANKAISKFFAFIVEESFPVRRRVVCG